VWVGELLGRVLSDIIINIYDMKTWKNLEVGDEVRNLSGTRTILAKGLDRYMVSSHDRYSASAMTFTKEEFQDCGYKIVQPEQEKSWFINSRGEVMKSGNVKSSKHMKRIAWGNAFASRERAQEVAEMIKFVIDAPVIHVPRGNIDSI
jgi:hypothetical protein